jgi:hypothetical protein
MSNINRATGPAFDPGPNDGRVRSEEASEQISEQRSMEDSAGADASLVRQMSHGDESIVHEGDNDPHGVVGYVDEHGMENRPDEGTREYDKE